MYLATHVLSAINIIHNVYQALAQVTQLQHLDQVPGLLRLYLAQELPKLLQSGTLSLELVFTPTRITLLRFRH